MTLSPSPGQERRDINDTFSLTRVGKRDSAQRCSLRAGEETLRRGVSLLYTLPRYTLVVHTLLYTRLPAYTCCTSVTRLSVALTSVSGLSRSDEALGSSFFS